MVNVCIVYRNDFQFKGSWIPASKSIENIVKHISNPKNEVLYIPIDADPQFFNNITNINIYRWYHLFNINGTLYNEFNKKFGEIVKQKNNIILNKRKIDGKIIALIEMIICVCSKRFFGRISSTYSPYITRIRGYIDAIIDITNVNINLERHNI